MEIVSSTPLVFKATPFTERVRESKCDRTLPLCMKDVV